MRHQPLAMVEQLQHLGCGQAFAAGLGGARRRCAVPLQTTRPAPCRPPARPRSSRRLGASVEPAATPLRWQRQRQRRANSGAPLRHGPCPRPTKHQPLPRYYRQAGQAHHQKTTQQRATDPLIAPRQGLRKIAAQHHRHAQHQPMRALVDPGALPAKRHAVQWCGSALQPSGGSLLPWKQRTQGRALLAANRPARPPVGPISSRHWLGFLHPAALHQPARRQRPQRRHQQLTPGPGHGHGRIGQTGAYRTGERQSSGTGTRCCTHRATDHSHTRSDQRAIEQVGGQAHQQLRGTDHWR